MEETLWRITLLWKLNSSSYSTLSLTFIMRSICVCVCVIETHLWKQLSWPPSPLPHPVPAVSQQLTALHLSSQPPTFPYLCSCLFVSTSPFPLSTHSFYLISLVVRFPLSIPSISFSIVSLVWLSCNFCSDITPSPSSSLPLLIWLLSWTTHLLLFFYKLTSFDYRYLHLTQSFSFYPLLATVHVNPSPSLCSTNTSLTAMCCKQRCWPRASTPWQARLRQMSLTSGRIPKSKGMDIKWTGLTDRCTQISINSCYTCRTLN